VVQIVLKDVVEDHLGGKLLLDSQDLLHGTYLTQRVHIGLPKRAQILGRDAWVVLLVDVYEEVFVALGEEASGDRVLQVQLRDAVLKAFVLFQQPLSHDWAQPRSGEVEVTADQDQVPRAVLLLPPMHLTDLFVEVGAELADLLGAALDALLEHVDGLVGGVLEVAGLHVGVEQVQPRIISEAAPFIVSFVELSADGDLGVDDAAFGEAVVADPEGERHELMPQDREPRQHHDPSIAQIRRVQLWIFQGGNVEEAGLLGEGHEDPFDLLDHPPSLLDANYVEILQILNKIREPLLAIPRIVSGVLEHLGDHLDVIG